MIGNVSILVQMRNVYPHCNVLGTLELKTLVDRGVTDLPQKMVAPAICLIGDLVARYYMTGFVPALGEVARELFDRLPYDSARFGRRHVTADTVWRW